VRFFFCHPAQLFLCFGNSMGCLCITQGQSLELSAPCLQLLSQQNQFIPKCSLCREGDCWSPRWGYHSWRLRNGHWAHGSIMTRHTWTFVEHGWHGNFPQTDTMTVYNSTVRTARRRSLWNSSFTSRFGRRRRPRACRCSCPT
jgi:hypothetical protein